MIHGVMATECAHQNAVKPKVLIGIVTRDRAHILPKAIDSALRQNYARLSVAVIDDGSTDGTSALAERYPNVEWIRWESPRGYVEGRNLLMARTEADYYLSLDDDAWFVGSDEVAEAVAYLENHPSVAALAYDILSRDQPSEKARARPMPTHLFIGCGHILRLSAVRATGLYAPTPGAYGAEETDLCLRLLDRSWEIHQFRGVHIWHDQTNVARDRQAQLRSGVCNDLAVTARRCPLPLLIGVLPYKVFSHLRFGVRHQQLNACLSGVSLFLQNFWSIMRTRSPVRIATFRRFVRMSHAAV